MNIPGSIQMRIECGLYSRQCARFPRSRQNMPDIAEYLLTELFGNNRDHPRRLIPESSGTCDILGLRCEAIGFSDHTV